MHAKHILGGSLLAAVILAGCSDHHPTAVGPNDAGKLFSVSANASSVTVITNPDAYTCAQPGFITFEEFPDQHNLSGAGSIAGVEFTTTGGFTWLVGDFDTGNYNGKYPNGSYMSQGSNWAWLGPDQGTGRIDFVEGPASYISVLVSVGGSPVYMEAYDAAGNLLEVAGPAAANIDTGTMTELKIEREEADIAYVIIHDTGNFFLVDAICTDAPGVPGGEPSLLPLEADVISANRLLPRGTVTLNRPFVAVGVLGSPTLNLPGTFPALTADDIRVGEDFESGVPATSFSYMDVNRDGQPDLVVFFDTAALMAAGLLDPDTTELTLFIRDSTTGQIYYVTVPVTLFRLF